jgi:hypothetical protein
LTDLASGRAASLLSHCTSRCVRGMDLATVLDSATSVSNFDGALRKMIILAEVTSRVAMARAAALLPLSPKRPRQGHIVRDHGAHLPYSRTMRPICQTLIVTLVRSQYSRTRGPPWLSYQPTAMQISCDEMGTCLRLQKRPEPRNTSITYSTNVCNHR